MTIIKVYYNFLGAIIVLLKGFFSTNFKYKTNKNESRN